MENINVYIQDENFEMKSLEVPLGVELNLMEVLKSEGYPIEAICGGIALCATCRVQVLNKEEVSLNSASDDEMAILETLPCYTGNCRLSCQIKISANINGLKVRLPQEESVFS
jgi:ferredoxin, 2Fe-2S